MHLSHYKSEITIENDKKLDQIIEKVIQKLVDHEIGRASCRERV